MKRANERKRRGFAKIYKKEAVQEGIKWVKRM
jgi:hypothetical protein